MKLSSCRLPVAPSLALVLLILLVDSYPVTTTRAWTSTTLSFPTSRGRRLDRSSSSSSLLPLWLAKEESSSSSTTNNKNNAIVDTPDDNDFRTTKPINGAAPVKNGKGNKAKTTTTTTTTTPLLDQNKAAAQDDKDTRVHEEEETAARTWWREKVQALAFRTRCGFQATATDQQRMRYLIQQLAVYNPTQEPAAAYYPNRDNDGNNDKPSSACVATVSSLTGQWTLIYTDAPDILTLADNNNNNNNNQERLARLQRIGQECNNEKNNTITNVIEWAPPQWAGALPEAWTGSNLYAQRLLQKVVTQASASPRQPYKVNLKLQGLQVQWINNNHNDDDDDENPQTAILPRLWQRFLNPLQLQGPVTAPFGSFEILYLDDELRVVQTNQGYYAVNRRNTNDTAWF